MTRRTDLIMNWIIVLSFSFKIIFMMYFIILASVNFVEIFLGYLAGLWLWCNTYILGKFMTSLINTYKKPKLKQAHEFVPFDNMTIEQKRKAFRKDLNLMEGDD